MTSFGHGPGAFSLCYRLNRGFDRRNDGQLQSPNRQKGVPLGESLNTTPRPDAPPLSCSWVPDASVDLHPEAKMANQLAPIHRMPSSRIKVIFHIGLEKTGTTSFQRFCTRNARRLLKHNVLYPKRSSAFHALNHTPLTASYLHSENPDDLLSQVPRW
jgi:hypothetical protein